MSNQESDAIVFFGASGDLAYKQIFPSLLRLVRDEGINVPIVGVAKSAWTIDDLRNRAKASLDEHGGADPESFQKLASLLRYVDGDYNDKATFVQLRKELGDAKHPLHYLAIPPSLFAVRDRGAGEIGLRRQCLSGDRKAFRPQPGIGARIEWGSAPILSRGEYFPDRPLSRQGTGAEYPLCQVFQPDL